MSTGAGYAGDISPTQAMELLKSGQPAVLIDVRTSEEWDAVGVPDLSSVGSDPVFVEWVMGPARVPNPSFVQDLKAELTRRGADADTPLLFLCRSGARSAAAAAVMTGEGYGKSHNIEGGFEGSPAAGLTGWKQIGLPWKRSDG